MRKSRKSISYRQKQGFSLEGGKWHYEGDNVNVVAEKPSRGVNSFEGAEIRSVCEDIHEIILEKDNMRYRVDIHSIREISPCKLSQPAL